MAKTTAFVPTDAHRKIIAMAAAIGIPQEDARLLILDPRTGKPIGAKALREHFRADLDAGKFRAGIQVANALYSLAVGSAGQPPNVAACIFWLKTRMGWRETKPENEPGPLEGKPRGALIVPGTYDVDSWTAAAAKEAAHQDRLRGEVLKP